MARPRSNKLTAAEVERLAVLMEEMAEAQQVIGKILRHGYHQSHPNGGLNNRQLLEKELGDVAGALHLSIAARDVKWKPIADNAEDKIGSLRHWTWHQGKALLDRAEAAAMTKRLA